MNAIRLIASFAIAGTAVIGSVLLALNEPDPDPAKPSTASIEVREDRSEEAKKLEVRIEEEKKKIEEKLRKQFEKQFEKVAELKKEITAQSKRIAQQQTDLAKEKTTLDEKTEKIAELEEKIRKREVSAEKEIEANRQRQEKLAELEKRAMARETKVDKQEKALEELTQTLLQQQAAMKAAEELAAQDKKAREADVRRREDEMRKLAKDLGEKQDQIRKDQESMRRGQTSLTENQQKNEKEWRKIQDAYKRLEVREAEIEKRLKQANLSAGEWKKIKAEWDRLAKEKAKLTDHKAVKENVERFKRTFDANKYATEVAKLMQGTSLRKVESDFIPFNFFKETRREAQSQLNLFSIKDVYLNGRTMKYVVVSDYSSGYFSSEGTWDGRELADKFPAYSSVVLEREKTSFYRDWVGKAVDRVGGNVSSTSVFGLIPKVMMYEIYLHQKRVMALRGLDRSKVLKYRFASFHHAGKWRFKVIGVTVRNATGTTVLSIGNYSF